MADIKKVIKGVEHCFHGQECCGDIECPYYIEHLSDCCCLGECQENLKADALALLKEQEKPNGKCVNECECWDSAYERGKQDALKEQDAVEPKYNARTNWYECGNCHYSMTSGMHCRSELIPATKVRYCANCGFPVNWEGR